MKEILSAEDLEREAKQAYSKKDYFRAATVFNQAASARRAKNDKTGEAEQLNNASVAWLQAGDPEKAHSAAAGTEIIFEQAGDPVRQAMALGNQASALEELHRDKEALPLYQQSAALLKEADEKELRSFVMKKISALQVRTGKKMEATASMYGALQDKEKLTGKEKTLKKLLDTVYGYMGIKTK
jgi:hypothetical protein